MSECCVCAAPWDVYAGKFKCAGLTGEKGVKCSVPVLVCDACAAKAKEDASGLRCPLCVKGLDLRDKPMPDLLRGKRQLAALHGNADAVARGEGGKEELGEERCAKRRKKMRPAASESKRLFVGNLPYTPEFSTLSRALSRAAAAAAAEDQEQEEEKKDVVAVQWLLDKKTSLFYGSAFVQMRSKNLARRVMAAAKAIRPDGSGGIRYQKRLLRVNFAPLPEGAEPWPPEDHKQLERPPISCGQR